MRHALFQIQPILEREKPRSVAPFRARAGDDADCKPTRTITRGAAYIWLFLGSGLWLIRCWADLGLSRRPLLEPNLNASGLLCLSVGVLGLLLAETVSLPVEDGAARNPAEPSGREDRALGRRGLRPNRSPSCRRRSTSSRNRFLLRSSTSKPQVIVARVLASIAHLSLVVMLLLIGWRHFRPAV